MTIDGTPYPVGGDIIVSINGTKIINNDALASYLVEYTIPGQTVVVGIIRNGASTSVNVVTRDSPPAELGRCAEDRLSYYQSSKQYITGEPSDPYEASEDWNYCRWNSPSSSSTVFALQGDGIIGGSSLMDNNSNFVYIGSLVAVVGLVIIAFGLRMTYSKPAAKAPRPEQPEKSQGPS